MVKYRYYYPKGRFRFGNKKYRIKTEDNYYMLYKPYFKYSYDSGYVKEHRYIYHIYLSIKYNRIVYLPTKKYEIHHKDGNGLNNKIKNLQIVTKAQHRIIDRTVDKSKYFCNICKTKKTYCNWYDDINGKICSMCYKMLQHYKKKFGII